MTTAHPTPSDYEDGRIACTPDAVQIRGYYFPWGTKRIPYDEIRSIRRVGIGALTGRARIWGTANPRYWANLDPARPRKKIALILDLGHHVSPYLTPDDPDGAEAVMRERAHLGPADRHTRRGPII